MVISTSLTNRINNVIKAELDLMHQQLIDLDFEDDYINDLAKEVTSTSKQGKLLRSMLTLLIGQMSEEMDENININILTIYYDVFSENIFRMFHIVCLGLYPKILTPFT